MLCDFFNAVLELWFYVIVKDFISLTVKNDCCRWHAVAVKSRGTWVTHQFLVRGDHNDDEKNDFNKEDDRQRREDDDCC